jgi:hypothetical protein
MPIIILDISRDCSGILYTLVWFPSVMKISPISATPGSSESIVGGPSGLIPNAVGQAGRCSFMAQNRWCACGELTASPLEGG